MDVSPTTADMVKSLETLLDQAKAGRLSGIAATVHYQEGGYGTLVSHAGQWNPLLILGGIARLERYVQTIADHSGY